MRLAATGLLAAMAALYVVAAVWPHAPSWLGYVRAFAEAATVGACADWFAVTALFRRPFGLPIPHTGIVPRNKARIGEALGAFIADNFLTAEVLEAKLRQLEVGRWGCSLAQTPGEREGRRRTARQIDPRVDGPGHAGRPPAIRRRGGSEPGRQHFRRRRWPPALCAPSGAVGEARRFWTPAWRPSRER